MLGDKVSIVSIFFNFFFLLKKSRLRNFGGSTDGGVFSHPPESKSFRRTLNVCPGHTISVGFL